MPYSGQTQHYSLSIWVPDYDNADNDLISAEQERLKAEKIDNQLFGALHSHSLGTGVIDEGNYLEEVATTSISGVSDRKITTSGLTCFIDNVFCWLEGDNTLVWTISPLYNNYLYVKKLEGDRVIDYSSTLQKGEIFAYSDTNKQGVKDGLLLAYRPSGLNAELDLLPTGKTYIDTVEQHSLMSVDPHGSDWIQSNVVISGLSASLFVVEEAICRDSLTVPSSYFTAQPYNILGNVSSSKDIIFSGTGHLYGQTHFGKIGAPEIQVTSLNVLEQTKFDGNVLLSSGLSIDGIDLSEMKEMITNEKVIDSQSGKHIHVVYKPVHYKDYCPSTENTEFVFSGSYIYESGIYYDIAYYGNDLPTNEGWSCATGMSDLPILINEEWNDLDDWATAGTGTIEINPASQLHTFPDVGTVGNTLEQNITFPAQYTVLFKTYFDSLDDYVYGVGQQSTYRIYFYESAASTWLIIYRDQIRVPISALGGDAIFSLQTQEQIWYTWCFVVDRGAQTANVYRRTDTTKWEFINQFATNNTNHFAPPRVRINTTRRTTGGKGEVHTEYTKVYGGLYNPVNSDPDGFTTVQDGKLTITTSGTEVDQYCYFSKDWERHNKATRFIVQAKTKLNTIVTDESYASIGFADGWHEEEIEVYSGLAVLKNAGYSFSGLNTFDYHIYKADIDIEDGTLDFYIDNILKITAGFQYPSSQDKIWFGETATGSGLNCSSNWDYVLAAEYAYESRSIVPYLSGYLGLDPYLTANYDPITDHNYYKFECSGGQPDDNYRPIKLTLVAQGQYPPGFKKWNNAYFWNKSVGNAINDVALQDVTTGDRARFYKDSNTQLCNSVWGKSTLSGIECTYNTVGNYVLEINSILTYPYGDAYLGELVLEYET